MLLFCVDCKRGGWVGTIPEMVKKGGGVAIREDLGFLGSKKGKVGPVLLGKR